MAEITICAMGFISFAVGRCKGILDNLYGKNNSIGKNLPNWFLLEIKRRDPVEQKHIMLDSQFCIAGKKKSHPGETDQNGLFFMCLGFSFIFPAA